MGAGSPNIGMREWIRVPLITCPHFHIYTNGQAGTLVRQEDETIPLSAGNMQILRDAFQATLACLTKLTAPQGTLCHMEAHVLGGQLCGPEGVR